MEYSRELVLKVNEVYHNIIGEIYDKKYFQSHVDEFYRWQNFGKQYLANNYNKINILDIGTGTGFIPSIIGKYLKKEDLFICSDISTKMLEICRKKLSNKRFNFVFKILKLDGNKLNLDPNEADFVTLNSVLHHIPEFSSLFKEINRILKIGGRLVIGHEPNKIFVKNKFLFINFRLINLIFDKKRIFPTILRKIKFQKLSKRLEYLYKNNCNSKVKNIINRGEIVEKINESIIKMKIVEKPLSSTEISTLIDFHSPTAFGYRYDKGINIHGVVKKFIPNFEIEYFETYNHLGKASNINSFTKFYDLLLRKILPKKGATFFVILKKAHEISSL